LAARRALGAVAEGKGDNRLPSRFDARWATDGIEVTTPAQPSSAPTGCFSKDEVRISFEASILTGPAPDPDRPATA
jgi:hypothetical protein